MWDKCTEVLNSKVEIDFDIFLIVILFSLVTIGKEFCTTHMYRN